MNILCVYGTRPEYIKVKPLFNEFDKAGIKYKTLFTGQHKDLVKSSPDYSWNMKQFSENRLNSVLMNTLQLGDIYFTDITHVLVQGDTSSVLGLALNAYNRGLKVMHLEAGLRTYDNQNPFPEEVNRRMVSQIADIHLCPTILSKDNLLEERVLGEMFVVGNTALDNLVDLKKECEYTDKILITLHRRENHPIMREWFIAINIIAERNPTIDFIFPMHPNPNVQKHKELFTAANVTIVEPMNHDELMKILVKTKLVITDSGGIQEESSFFNKICLTCRTVTERPEAIGQSTVLVDAPTDLFSIFTNYITKFEIDFVSPFGDGTSAKKIGEIFKK